MLYSIDGFIRDLIRSVTKKSNDYDEKYIKIKFDLDDKLSLNKTINIPVIIITNIIHKFS